MKSIPPEAGPYVLASAIMAVLFIAAMVRLWLLRRVEAKLLKNKDALEAQIVTQQKDLLQVRSDSNAWRAEMQRQFDHFRHMASDQLKVEEGRFDNLLTKSRDREHELQTTLDIARQMCAELPSAKARVMQLENLLGIDGGEGLTSARPPVETAAPSSTPTLAMLPDLDGAAPAAEFAEPTIPEPLPEPAEPTIPEPLPEPAPAVPAEVLVESITDVPSHELQDLRQQNAMLQQALTAERLRSRIREKAAASGSRRKNGRA